ncbi:Rdx family protein [Natronosalvus halobius]|uniref:Rdx family protein n=1 Tax=Natronosalvus halobius TaxID=2953746 RepID=UPI00209F0955|nr:Rdx family protein [Natronosalvus halobius]USZ73257.1 Rdx family protein [Natronosalvus halobius]
MPSLEIEYCHPCGFLDRALDVQAAVMRSFGGDLKSATLTVGDHGVFVVRVDDTVVFNVSEEPFDVDEIVRTVRAEL